MHAKLEPENFLQPFFVKSDYWTMTGDATATNVAEGLAVGIDLGTTASVTYAINKNAQPLCVTTASVIILKFLKFTN